MVYEPPTTPLVIRLATPDDIPLINLLDSYSDSSTRDIHREIEKYFGSVDPSTHEKTLIFLAEVEGVGAAKAELMLPPAEAVKAIGYIKRVVVDPQHRKRGLARPPMLQIITFSPTELHIQTIYFQFFTGQSNNMQHKLPPPPPFPVPGLHTHPP